MLNKQQIKDFYEYAMGRIDAFYKSTTYTNAVLRYEIRRDAYYRKRRSNEPVWKSKLYFPAFFMACKGFEAQIKATIQSPIVKISFRGIDKKDAAMIQKERLANHDLLHDLYVSDFERSLFMMYWYNEVFGTSVARESIISEQEVKQTKSVLMDRFGNELRSDNQEIHRKEHTKTDVIHPLNMAHMINRGEFTQSPWASVRYEMSMAELYAMRIDPDANKDDLEEIIKAVESGDSDWSASQNQYYVDNIDMQSTSGNYQNTIIVDEYSGDANFKGNMEDSSLYFGIMSRKHNKWLRVGQSPYFRHHYWKMRTHPDPFSPYGVGACDSLIPLNIMKNAIFNQYMDWGNANLKYMYEIFPGYVKGGLAALIQGLPGGIIEAADETSWKSGQLIRPIQKDKSGIPGVSDIMNFLDKAETKSSPANDMRSKTAGMTDTATGVMEVSKKEDDMIGSIVDDLDHGLVDGIRQKVKNRINLMSQPVEARIQDSSPPIRYFPFELDQEGTQIEVNRISPTMEANKYISWLAQVSNGIKSFGMQVPPEKIMELYARVGRDLGIDGVEEMMAPPAVAPEIGAGGMSGPAMPPSMPQPPAAGPQIPQGVGNAMALA